MQFQRLLAAAVLGATSLCSHAATYQLTYVSEATASWSDMDLNRHGAVSGVTYGENFTSRAHIFENGSTRLLEAVGDYNRGAAINDRGDVSGQCQKIDRRRACIWKANGKVVMITNTLGGPKSEVDVYGINNAGQVAGTAWNADKHQRPFLYENGSMRDLGSFGGSSSEATGINEKGHVSGYATLPNGHFHAFIHDGTQLKDLGTLSSHSFAEALNDNDVAVGRADVEGGERHAVMFKNGQVIDLGTLGGPSEAWGVNNHEEVVGNSHRSDNSDYRAFVYRKGHMIDLNTELDPVSGAGWKLLTAARINDRGQILAVAKHGAEFEDHVVLLTPMP